MTFRYLSNFLNAKSSNLHVFKRIEVVPSRLFQQRFPILKSKKEKGIEGILQVLIEIIAEISL